MPDPTPRQGGWVDNHLTTVAIGYMQGDEMAVADQVFPVVGVDLPTAKYKVFNRSFFMRDEVGPRPYGGYPRQTGFKTSEDSYYAEEEALEGVIEDRDRASEDPPGRIERAKIRLLTMQHQIHKDRRWAAKYFKTTVWGTDLTGVPSGTPSASQFLQWDNDNSNPIKELSKRNRAQGKSVGRRYKGNVLVLGSDVATALESHPLLIGRLAVNQDRVVTEQVLASFFNVPKVVVAETSWNSGPEKETAAATDTAAVYDFVFGAKDALLVYAAANPSSEEPSGGYTFAWKGLLGAQADNPHAAVNRGRDDRGYTDWFHVRTAYDQKVTAPELGVFFSGAVG